MDLFNTPQSRMEELSINSILGADPLPQWPLVQSAEVKTIITRLKANKAPCEDFLPPELFKQNINWWAQLLAGLFNHINKACSVPSGWKLSIIVPIFKKGDKADPRNYRPISLIDITAKIYARYLLDKVEEWAENNRIIKEEQAGFRQGYSTIDNAFILQHVIDKYSSLNRSLYVAFIDLSAAFDSISRGLLWRKFSMSNIDKRLLALLIALYADSSVKVRLGNSGAASNGIASTRGVRQGCLLAPFCFNFYINDIVEYLKMKEYHGPKIMDRELNILIYADDIVLLSTTPVGLRRSLQKLSHYCAENALTINKEKSKIMVFGKKTKVYNWHLDGHKVEQVRISKYLGLHFAASGAWSQHLKLSIAKADNAAQAIHKLCNHNYPGSLRPFLKVLKAKALYGAEIWGIKIWHW
uniref:ribonuclease H n=1 Tax=Anolis carolinensis TaxID=28377 RepID=A0A803TKK2_ANOCA